MRRTLFIGGFQPLHLGHLPVIKKINKAIEKKNGIIRMKEYLRNKLFLFEMC